MPNPREADVCHAFPVIDVTLLPPGVTEGDGISCTALIDTGADHTLVDRSLLEQLGLDTAFRTIANHGAIGVTETTLHKVTLMLTAADGSRLAFNCDAAAQGTSWPAMQIILGRSLFQHGSLTIDYPNGNFRFEVDSQ